MNNSQIADQFSLLSKLMDIHGENSFRAKAFAVAAFTIDRLSDPVAEMDDAAMFAIRGIGKGMTEYIRELCATGKLQLLDDIVARTPHGIIELLSIKGLGPKKIAEIWRQLGIESVGELEYACNENRLVALKGFGAKTQESILQSIAYLRQQEGLYLWADAMKFTEVLVGHLSKIFPGARFEPTGGLRRQIEVVDELTLISDVPESTLVPYLEKSPNVKIKTHTAARVTMDLVGFPTITIYLSQAGQYFTNLFKTTGSPAFIKAFEDHYIYPETALDEKAIFSQNRLQEVPPPLREEGDILVTALNELIPTLIQPADIRGIIHCHSTYSDGSNTLEQMVQHAIKLGYEYLVISDHSQAAAYAGGLTPQKIAAQHHEIDQLNGKYAPFKIIKSIEADILGTGELDYYPALLDTFDIVIASVHSNLKMSLERAMERVMKAVENPYTGILGHPTGRLLLSRPGYPLQMEKVIDACAAHNVVVEINAHPKRLDLDWRMVKYAMDKGVLMSIDPDAHALEGFHDVVYGVMAAQKGGLTKTRNLSSYTLTEFEKFVNEQRLKRPK